MIGGGEKRFLESKSTIDIEIKSKKKVTTALKEKRILEMSVQPRNVKHLTREKRENAVVSSRRR